MEKTKPQLIWIVVLLLPIANVISSKTGYWHVELDLTTWKGLGISFLYLIFVLGLSSTISYGNPAALRSKIKVGTKFCCYKEISKKIEGNNMVYSYIIEPWEVPEESEKMLFVTDEELLEAGCIYILLKKGVQKLG
jgi:hypothetical protein